MSELSLMTIVGTRPTLFKDAMVYYRSPKVVDARNKKLLDGSLPGMIIAHSGINSKGDFYWVFNPTAKLNDSTKKIISEVDPVNNRFYIKHEKGLFNEENLITQGALTKNQVLDQIKADNEKDEKGVVPYYIERYGKPVLGVATFLLLAKIVVPEIIKARK